MEFRDYQTEIIQKASRIVKDSGFVYLAMEVRTGKTLTSLGLADNIGAKNVLFLTKKKAVSSIQSDYNMLNPSYNMVCVNYESIHKIDSSIKWDFVILDEAHGLSAYPKPSKRAKQVKALIAKDKPFICMLSGTPTPESYSQMYHQVYGIPNNPFSEFKNFYRFCDVYVNLTQRKINGYTVNGYSGGKKSIVDKMSPYMISYTQKQAGFTSEIEEEIIKVPVKTNDICNQLKKDLVIEIGDEAILADTGVKLMSKLHQLYSGTVKFESGKSVVMDTSKAEYIKWRFTDSKLGIFYKFKAELEALKQVFGDDICTDLEEFNTTDKHIALQIVSGREGISLRNADYVVFYNIDFSATSYWQARDRMTTKDRRFNKVYWLFAEGGIESKVYKSVINKKDYTLKHFKNDELSRFRDSSRTMGRI